MRRRYARASAPGGRRALVGVPPRSTGCAAGRRGGRGPGGPYAPEVDTDVRLGESLSRVLDATEGSSPVEAVEAVTRLLGTALGAHHASLLIADLSGRALVRLSHVAPGEVAAGGGRWDDEEHATVLPFDGGPAEQVLRSQQIRVLAPGTPGSAVAPGRGWLVLAPITERGETVGLLEMSLPLEPGQDVVAEISRTAHLLAFVVIANRRHTDLFEWGQRSTPFTLPAEIQRRLLPAAFTCEAGAFALSAWLEPSADVAGDTFDYSLGRDELHLSVTDAMGHGVASALAATLCVGSLRHTRRQGATLLEQVEAANAALVTHASTTAEDIFVTGVLGRIDLHSGTLAMVNAGHVWPFLARDGAVSVLEMADDLPMGLFGNATYRVTEVDLRRGDRLVFVTDGMVERSAAGIDLVAEIAASISLHPREATRCLADRVLAAAGPVLDDDAALLVVDWHGRHGRDRVTDAGADV